LPSEPRRVAFLAHCLLNQNAKVDEGAKAPAMWGPMVHLLREHGYELRQMPCPELAFMGARRFWGVKEQFDTPGYRAHCRRLAAVVADVMEPHLRAGDHVVLVGNDSSPSLGVNRVPSADDWSGAPMLAEDDSVLVPGEGIFVAALRAELESRGLEMPPRVGTRHWWPDYDEAEERARVEAILA
jgi:predicted secreted protein